MGEECLEDDDECLEDECLEGECLDGECLEDECLEDECLDECLDGEECLDEDLCRSLSFDLCGEWWDLCLCFEDRRSESYPVSSLSMSAVTEKKSCH